MKKITKTAVMPLISLAMCCCSALAVAGCARTFVAASEFYWSSDAGVTYGNRKKEFEVGENVYMQLIVRIDSNKKSLKEVGVSLTIPYIKDVASKYMDGQPIHPEVDELNQLTIYNFTVNSKKESSETSFTFRFVPIKATDITLMLTFDDQVSPIYDKQNTITFIESGNPDEAE